MNQITYIQKFLKRDRVQNCLAAEDLDKIYIMINFGDVDFDTGAFTDYLYAIDVNPLKYVTYVHDYMYDDLETMSTIHIPSNITSIGQYAFRNCVSLEDVIIDEGCYRIESNAFDHCRGLTKIVIPKSVTTIEKFVFYGCDLRALTIFCVKDSVAHKYAIDNEIDFELI